MEGRFSAAALTTKLGERGQQHKEENRAIPASPSLNPRGKELGEAGLGLSGRERGLFTQYLFAYFSVLLIV
jgi:hypothetical protein